MEDSRRRRRGIREGKEVKEEGKEEKGESLRRGG